MLPAIIGSPQAAPQLPANDLQYLRALLRMTRGGTGMDEAVSLLAAVVTYCFAAAVFDQYLHRRRPYQLIWCLALAAFAVAFTAQFFGSVGGWTPALFRVWYGFGALNAVPLLGLGTVYLLCPRWAKIAGTVIAVELMFWGFARIYGVPLSAAQLVPAPGATHPDTQAVLPPDIRATAVLLNMLGTLVLVAGAAWSAWSFRRRRTAPHRVASNLLIAAGALLAGAAGGLEKYGYPSLLYLGNLAGITVLFLGFLRSGERLDPAHLPVLRHFRASHSLTARS